MKKSAKIFIASFWIATLSLAMFTGCGEKSLRTTVSKDKLVEFASGIKLLYPGDRVAVVDTEKGLFAFELYETLVPKTTENFVDLVSKGFYNGLTWHRVAPGVLLQTGDPTGIGMGGANVPPLPLEIHPDLVHDAVGIVAMARKNSDINSATSQFYITLAPQPEWDRKYAVFGKVLKGTEVLSQIEQKDKVRQMVVVGNK